jgi:hypothetical protein
MAAGKGPCPEPAKHSLHKRNRTLHRFKVGPHPGQHPPNHTPCMTRGEVLRYAIAFALRRSRKTIRGLKEGLTEEERYAVADHARRAANGARRSLAAERRGAYGSAAVNMKRFRVDGRHPRQPPAPFRP